MKKNLLQAEGFSLLLRLLAPITPHMTDVLWQQLGLGDNINQASWPKLDETALISASQQIVIQVNGKLRGKLEVATTISQEDATQAVLAMPELAKFLDGKKLVKVIFVPGKLMNLVVQDV